MKKIISLLAVFFALLPSTVLAKEKEKLYLDDIAENIAAQIVEQIRCNKQQKTPYTKTHIVDIDQSYYVDHPQYFHYVNSGAFFWNLSDQDKAELNAKVNNYASVFEDVEYIMVIGSVFKFDNINVDK